MRRSTTKVSFKPDYIRLSKVQFKQNQKFLKFIYNVLKEKSDIASIVEIGVGDGYIAEKLNRIFSPQRLYLIDTNEYFLEHASKFIPGARCINKNVLDTTLGDIDNEPVDVVITSNFLHWLSLKDQSWFDCVKLIWSFLKPGGYFFIHQGLKWTYFTLYDLGNELFKRMFGKVIDISEILYYPYCREILDNFKEVGFCVVSYKDFYELEEFNAPYGKEELYVSFSVAGINVFLSQIEDEEEKGRFEKEFLRLCEIHTPPIFAHRGFFALRKPYSNLAFYLIPPRSASYEESQKMNAFIREVSSDFVPPLETRTPDDEFYEGDTKYAEYLLAHYYNLICFFEKNPDEWIGLLSFRIKNSFSNPGTPCIYVSTLAVKRPFRNARVATQLYNYFLNKVVDKYTRERKIRLIETRTWNTNIASRKLLGNLGFRLVKVIPHHRGENLHTEYYIKNV